MILEFFVKDMQKLTYVFWDIVA